MDALTAAKLWLLIRPVKRIRQWRTRRKMRSWYAEHGQPLDETAEDFNSTDEVPVNKALVTQILLAVLRHAMTAGGVAGVAVSDEWLAQTAAVLVGVGGMAWSIARKKARGQDE